MSVFRALVRRELSAFFQGPTGFIIIAAVLFLIGLGFVVVAPDSMADAARRWRPSRGPFGPDAMTDYWHEDIVHCARERGPLVYSTSVEGVLGEGDAYHALLAAVFAERTRQLRAVVAALLGARVARAGGVWLAGVSEGAAAVARLDERRAARAAAALLRGRVAAAIDIAGTAAAPPATPSDGDGAWCKGPRWEARRAAGGERALTQQHSTNDLRRDRLEQVSSAA